jgi:hypothetical protein
MVINPLRRVTGFDTSGFWGARQGSTAGEHGLGEHGRGARFWGARWGARFVFVAQWITRQTSNL